MDVKLSRLQPVLGKRREIDNPTEKLVTWAGAYTILLVGFSHLLISGEHFLSATYLGLLFLANCAGSIVVAIGLVWGAHRWAWLLGDLVAGGAFVGYVVSRAIGLPDYQEVVGYWFNIGGLFTLGLESLFVALSLLALTPQGRALTQRVEQKRVELEQATTEQAPERIEREMSNIRGRMDRDLSDLRRHVEPQAVKERVKRGLWQRLSFNKRR